MSLVPLKQYYTDATGAIVTAHRGFSGSFPENTLTAFRQALELGAHIIEFDVRQTLDGELVILHDATLDRTTNGHGAIAQKMWCELSGLNATYWSGSHDHGKRLSEPWGEDGIPRLTDALELLAGRAYLNIQVYTQDIAALRRIVDLYLEYGLEKTAFLMLPNFEAAFHARTMNPDVALCVGESRNQLDRHLAFAVDYMQPFTDMLSVEYLRALLKSKIPFNVFYANQQLEIAQLLDRGVRGIMTDHPDRLLKLVNARMAAPDTLSSDAES